MKTTQSGPGAKSQGRGRAALSLTHLLTCRLECHLPSWSSSSSGNLLLESPGSSDPDHKSERPGGAEAGHVLNQSKALF